MVHSFNVRLAHNNPFIMCNAKIDPSSNRKNAARCASDGITKYAGRCAKHNPLPHGRFYSCMFKKQYGPNKGKFCTMPIAKCHKFLCSSHASRSNELITLLPAMSYTNAVFEQFVRGVGLPPDVTDVIKIHLHASVVDSLKRFSTPLVITHDAGTQTD